jgi:FKBP-type peptidyl-prolyl cis-trans isomerase (trigger factor)
MKIAIKKLDKLKREILVEVAGDEFVKEKNSIFKEKAKNLKVPGFRPGSAPMDILEKHHGPFLRDAFLNKAIPQFYQDALKQENIPAVSMPAISDVEMTSEKLLFRAEVEVRPEVKVEEFLYQGLKIKTKAIAVEEAEIEKVLTTMKDGIKKTLKKDLNDDEISKWASYPDMGDFRQVIKAQLTLEKAKTRRQDIDEQVKTKLLKAVNFDMPKAQVKQHEDELLNREVYNLQYRGVPAEDIEKYKDEIRKKIKPLAEEQVKLFYIFDAIAKGEGIESDDKMMDAVVGLILSQADYR